MSRANVNRRRRLNAFLRSRLEQDEVLEPLPTRITWTPERIEAELIRVGNKFPYFGCALARLEFSERQTVRSHMMYSKRAEVTFGITTQQAYGIMRGWDMAKDPNVRDYCFDHADPEFVELGKRVARAVPE